MIQTLTVDVAALQQLTEVEPLGLSYAEFGLCRGSVTCQLLLNTCVVTCLLGFTCRRGTVSAPPVE